jgi:HSP20 family molecular chaperone IbpA
MAKSKGYKSYVGKLGIGFDPVLDLIDSVDDATSVEDVTAIPPYNIKKTSDGGYTLELDLTGVDRKDIKATLDPKHLTIEATTNVGFDSTSASDDVYFHQGILAGGKVSAKFLVARNLAFKEANLDDGILSVVFTDTNSPRELTTLPIGPLPKSDVPYTVEYNSAGSPVMIPTGSDPNSEVAVPLELPTVEDQQAAVVTPPAPAPVDTPVADTPAPAPVETAPETTQVVVNDDTAKAPTVTVDTPVVVPPIVEATVSDVVPSVSNSSDQPQATVTLQDATHEVSDNATLTTVKTDEGKPDVVVAMSPDTVAAANAAGIDIPASVSAALDHPDVSVAPVEPAPVVTDTTPVPVADNNVDAPKVEVQVPDTLTPVVNVTTAVQADNSGTVPAVALTPSDGTNIPADSVLVPVVTQAGQNDVVAAVPPEVHDTLVNAGVDPSTAISQAVQAAAPDVTSTPVSDTVPVVTNDQNSVVATTTVEIPKELPQVVTAEVTDVKPVVDQQSAEPQATVTLSDSTHEIVSDNVVTTVAKTPDSNADVVVAVDADHQAEMKDKGIDVLQSAKDAIELAPAGVTLPDPPPPATEETKDAAPADVVVQPTADATAAPVTIAVPDTLQTVVKADVVEDESGKKVVLSDTQGQVPADATLTPVVTAPDEHDIVVATTPEADKALSELGVDVSKDVSTAVVAAGTPVVTSTDVGSPVDQTAPAPDTTSTPVVIDATPATPDATTTPDAPADAAPVVAPASSDAPADTASVVPNPVPVQPAPTDPTTSDVSSASPQEVSAPVADANAVPPPAPTAPEAETATTPADETPAPVEQQAPEALVSNTSSDLQ